MFLLALAAGACDRKVTGNGPEIYEKMCARCHGGSGVPEPGVAASMGVKDLTDATLQARLTDDEIGQQIRDGSGDKLMPAFDTLLSSQQVDSLVAHVRSLKRLR